VPEGLDDAAQAFATEVAPQSRPRDQGGKFVATTSKPEPMFGARPIEGDPLTGDTRDGGDNEGLRARERDIADGREERRSARREPEDDDVEDVDREPESIGEVDSDDETSSQDDENGDRYEVTVDGQPQEVSLQEALNGYVRQETFHKRMAQVNAATQELEADYQRLKHGWAIWNKARQDYEEDLINLTPKEPDWDAEFARDPRAAHAQQRIFQTIYNKLAMSRQIRAQREAEIAAENDRRVRKFAVDGFSQFVMRNIKTLPDEPTLKKNLQSMRKTAAAEGFSEYEVATVYDPRMLTILLKASKYDRMQANRLKPVDPSRGKTLTPGAATPLSGNGRRSGFDDAQRRLASSGKLQDAVDVFRRLL
jgi:hypothetical protein